ncbi:MAG: leucine-rich repeat protein [Bacteroidota bacterium]
MKTEAKRDDCKSHFIKFLSLGSFNYVRVAFLTALIALTLGHTVTAQYTLQDDDVVVTDGIIQSCSYDYAIKDIIIPEVLDGQDISGIGDRIFSFRDLTGVDLSACTALTSIGIRTFANNALKSIDLSSCSELNLIGTQAFAYNAITNVDLSACSALTSIGNRAFFNNDLSEVDLSVCTSLLAIGIHAFDSNGDLSHFSLPVNAEYEALNWKDDKGNVVLGGSSVYDLETHYFVPIPYTLTDDDVVVTDGIIQSCSYDFAVKDIIIPEVLDGQVVIGIADGGDDDNYQGYYGPFTSKGITSIVFPSSLETIGEYSCSNNPLISIDLSSCSALKTIRDWAFLYNVLTSIAFPNSLEIIGRSAFYGNDLTDVDLSNCTALTKIGKVAFDGNDNLSSISLPINAEYYEYNWKDAEGSVFIGGSSVNDFYTSYYVPAPYTLTDSDVIVVDGIIQSCTYNFALRIIEIPEILDGQEVIGISDNKSFGGVFSNKGIVNISFPSTFEIIGTYSFDSNDLTSIDLSSCTALTSIGNYAFRGNNLTNIDLSSCTALTSIGHYAFRGNGLTSVDFSNCTAITSIGMFAFGTNNLTSIDLSACLALTSIGFAAFNTNELSNVNFSGCTALTSIGKSAFAGNDLTNVDLSACKNLFKIGSYAFNYNYSLSRFTLPINTEYNLLGWRDANGNVFMGGDIVSDLESYYYVPIPYTLTDDDVEVTGGIIQSCSYNYEYLDIIIPEVLDGQTVLGIVDGINQNGVFGKERIASIKLPSTLVAIGDFAFAISNLSTVDLSACTNLTTIGVGAFLENQLKSIDFSGCKVLSTIGASAFSENSIVHIDLNTCTSLTTIEENAFAYNAISSMDLSACIALVYIGKRAFLSNYLSSRFALPIHFAYEAYGWKDSDGNTLNSGAVVSNLESFYYVPAPYSLTDNDVEVTDGIIQSCSYNFQLKVIIIPEVLDGQIVTGIGDWRNKGVFSSKGIVDVTLPPTVEIIGYGAFFRNDLNSVNLNSCTSLAYIGENAFLANDITAVDLSACTSLISIGYNAFAANVMSSFVLPTPDIPGYRFFYWVDGNGNSHRRWAVSDLNTSYTAFLTKITYTISQPGSGEEWLTSTVQNILWEDNYLGNVKIELYKGDALIFSIAGSTRSDGNFGWSIPPGLSSSSDYRIKISSLLNSTYYGFSDYFSIVYQSPCQDSYEPSNEFFKPNVSAFSNVLGAYELEEQITGTVHKPGDWDHYRVNVGEAGMLNLTLSDVPEGFDLQLFDSDRNYISGSFTSGDEEILETITSPGYYIVIVGSLSRTASCTPYTLQLDWSPGLPGCKDVFEPSNEFFKPNETAFSRSLRESFYTGSVSGTIHKPGDWDHYRVNVYVPGKLSLILSEVPEGFDLQLYDENRNYITGSFTAGDEEILEAIASPGDYVVIVGSLKRAASCAPYTLDLEWSPGLAGCEDIFEPSNEFFKPNVTAFTEILGEYSFVTHISATVHKAGDWDHYRIPIEEAGILNLTLSDAPDEFDLQLYDGNRNYISGSFTSGDEEIIEAIATPGYYIVIVGSMNRAASCTPYNLGVDWNPESFKKSTAVPGSRSDQAFFTVYPNPGTHIIYLKSDLDINEELSLRVFDLSGKVLSSNTLNQMYSEEPVEIDISAYAYGIYYLQLNSATLSKTLKIIKY